MRKYLLPLLLLTTVAPLLAGCFYSREIAGVRRDLERQHPETRFEREMVVTLGPGTFRTLSWMAGLVPEEEAEMASGYLDEVRRVKVGVYRVNHLPTLDAFDPPRLRRFEKRGWEVAVKTREDDGMVWVLYRERYGAVRDVFVFVLDEDNLVMARLEGHLNHLLERAVADHARLTAFGDW